MSQSNVEQIVGRLVLDPDFRQQMSTDRQRALAGYDLSEEERGQLLNLDLSLFAGAVSLLDERVSKGMSIQ
jgi:hypothetical protein